jgi:cytochrome c5
VGVDYFYSILYSTHIMVATRSKKSDDSEAGEKRAAPSSKLQTKQPAKKAKTEPDGKLEVGKDGQVGLKEAASEQPSTEDSETKKEKKEEGKKDGKEPKPKAGEDMDQTRDEMKAEEGEKAKNGEDEVDEKALQGIEGELDEPKHGKPIDRSHALAK